MIHDLVLQRLEDLVEQLRRVSLALLRRDAIAWVARAITDVKIADVAKANDSESV